ncbi:MAG: PEP-CTERM sorting domain-containing protein [Akkermansia sp.]
MGAIYNDDRGHITLIQADFIENSSLTSNGGAIYNGRLSSIDRIDGDFIANYSKESSLYSDNSYYTGGAAIYNNDGTIGTITGSFIGNYTEVPSETGAIYNKHRDIESIQADLIGNHAKDKSSAGAVYNLGGKITFDALIKDIQITGNYVDAYAIDDYKRNIGICNSYYSSRTRPSDGIINFNAYNDHQIAINDGISGGSPRRTDQILNINVADGATGIVTFNNTVEDNTINVHKGTLVLGHYEGGTLTLTGLDANADGVDDTMEVNSSSASFRSSYIKIFEEATVNTKADYLGNNPTYNTSNIIVNNGTLNIKGGALYQRIGGTGTTNVTETLNLAYGPTNIAADSTLNNYGTITGDVSVEKGADVNAIITWDNLGKTIFDGSVSGISSMDVSFDLSLDFNDVVGKTTTVYAQKSDDITLELVDSDHISGIIIAGNTVVVAEQIDVSTDDYNATVGKVDDKTYIDVTSGSFDIAEGEKQTLSSITTAEGATVKVTGGTLVTDNKLTLANDAATSGVKAESGVIESTATVQLSEGTTSVAEGKSLELKAAVELADDTHAILNATDASLILQQDVVLGDNSVLTMNGHVSGSANFIGSGNATINVTGVFSPGNSPELMSYQDVTINYEAGSVLLMEIFGEAGAGVDGGHDKIVFDSCDVRFDGTIQLSIDDVATLVGGDEDVVLTFDLFDFDGSASVLTEGEFVLVYNSSDWVITANTDSLYTTGEVSLSFVSVPEPSTATLSLLALAGMLARRRRKAA